MLIEHLSAVEVLVTALTSLLIAAGGLWVPVRKLFRGLGELREDARRTRHQTENSHGTNLRDDLDGMASKIDRMTDTLTHLDERDRKRQDTDVAIYTRLGQLAHQDELLHRRIDQMKDGQQPGSHEPHISP